MELDVAYLIDRPGVHGDLEAAGARLFSLDGPGGRAGWAWRAERLIAARRPRPGPHHPVRGRRGRPDRGRTGRGAGRVQPGQRGLRRRPRRHPGVRRWKVQGAHLVDAATARRVVRFHANTRYIADVMAPRLHVPRDRLEVIPRGRDPERLGRRDPERRAGVRAGLGVAPDTALLVAVARHEHQKGLDALLEALPGVLALVPGTRLVVAGRDGNQTPLLQAIVRRLGLEGAASSAPATTSPTCSAPPTRW